MIALVTGCAGFIGSHLVESLLVDGHEVIGIDALTDTYDREWKLRNLDGARDYNSFDFIQENLLDGSIQRLVDRSDVIFHLAGEPGVRDSWGRRFDTYLRNNVLATQRLLEATAPTPERPFVLASSSSIYGNADALPITEDTLPSPVSPYGVTKLAGENLCRAYAETSGVHIAVLRYFSVFGPRQRPDMAFSRFIRAALSGMPFEVYGTGQQSRDFTFADDVITATRAAVGVAEPGCRAYNVGGGVQTSITEVLGLLRAITGRALHVKYVSGARGDVSATHASISRSAAAFGYQPAVSLSQGLEAQVGWAESTVRRAA